MLKSVKEFGKEYERLVIAIIESIDLLEVVEVIQVITFTPSENRN